MIVGVSGKANSGKNQFAEYLKEIDDTFEIKAFAGKLKEIARLLTGWDDQYSREGKAHYLPDWGMTVGRFQQLLGTEAIRNGINSDAWVIALFADYAQDKNWAVTDVRFPNEVKAIQNRGGVVIRVERDCHDDAGRDEQHESETALDNFTGWDYVVKNNGTLDDLKQEALWAYLTFVT